MIQKGSIGLSNEMSFEEEWIFYKKRNFLGKDELKRGPYEGHLSAKTEKKTDKKDGYVFVSVSIVHKEGELLPTLSDDVRVHSIENGSLVRFGSSAPYTKEDFFDGALKTYYGRILLIAKPLKAKKLRVRFSSGYRSGEAETDIEDGSFNRSSLNNPRLPRRNPRGRPRVL